MTGLKHVFTKKHHDLQSFYVISVDFYSSAYAGNSACWGAILRIFANEGHIIHNFFLKFCLIDRLVLAKFYQYVSAWMERCRVGLRQEAQLSPRDRAMRRVNWNLANCHATVQKLLIRQVLTKSMVWSWRFSRRQCVIDNVHSTLTRPRRLPLSQVS